MRVPAWTLCAILASGAFLSLGAGTAASAFADTPGSATATSVEGSEAPRAPSVSPLPATRAEESGYAQREADAPAAVKGYAGGFIVGVLVAVLLIVLIVYLVKRT